MAFPTGWQRRAALVIESTLAPSNLTNFPLLLNADTLPAEMLVSGGANAAQADGGDIRFSTNSDGTGQLACEVVKWDQTNGLAEIWVLVPSISSVSDTTIYVWYKAGGSETQPAATDTYGRNAVWAAYEAVWHGDKLTDSTGNGFDLTETGSVGSSLGTTPWGGDAWEFNGDAANYLSRAAAVLTAEPISMSCVARLDNETATHFLMSLGNSGSTRLAHALGARGDVSNDPIQALSIGPTTSGEANQTNFAASTWFHAASVFADSSTRRAYLDGNGPGSTGGTASQSVTGLDRTAIGVLLRSTAGDATDGLIAEARIAASALSGDWLTAESRNLLTPGTYVTEGTPEDVGGGGSTGTAAQTIAAFLSSAAGLVGHLGSAAQTVAAFVSAGAGLKGSVAAAAQSLGLFSSAGSGTVGHVGTASPTMAAFRSQASGQMGDVEAPSGSDWLLRMRRRRGR